MLPQRLRFGAFIAPFHPVDENPTLAIQRDLELVEWLDQLGFDEAWIGEHHSAAYELIASPEVFIAAAAERTRHIRLGTGVSSLPYHHPLMLADRINQLDHMTRGRVMFGVGPGALVSDAFMMGIPVGKQRDRMDEALKVLVPLPARRGGDPQVRLVRAGQRPPADDPLLAALGGDRRGQPGLAHRRPRRRPARPGPAVAGRHLHRRFNALASNWAIANEQAAEHGQTMDRNAWRLVGPMHIAETREQAMEDVRFGLDKWIFYFREIANLPIVPEGDDPVQAMIDTGLAVIGTPDDAARRIQQLVDESGGGFGAFLLMAHNWAPWAATKRSYELMARYVFPKFQNLNDNRNASIGWVKDNKEAFTTEVRAAVGARIVSHMMEKGAENIRPEIVALITGAAAPPKDGG